jgi:hypothetical protein
MGRRPSGRLSLVLDGGYWPQGLRRTYSDGKMQRVEDLLDAALDALARQAAHDKQARADADRRQQEAAEAEAQRIALERKRQRDSKRLEFIDAQLARIAVAERAERFAAMFEDTLDGDDDLAKLVRWARDHALELRSVVTRDVLTARLAHYRLMDDTAAVYWSKLD